MPGQPRHPDPAVEAVRWGITEADVIQGAGRARGVQRTAGNPVRVVILARLALPLTVHETATWKAYKADKMETALAEAVLRVEALALSDSRSGRLPSRPVGVGGRRSEGPPAGRKRWTIP